MRCKARTASIRFSRDDGWMPPRVFEIKIEIRPVADQARARAILDEFRSNHGGREIPEGLEIPVYEPGLTKARRTIGTVLDRICARRDHDGWTPSGGEHEAYFDIWPRN
jgi:hypothetical protein